MSVELDAFRNAVQNAKNDSFIRMSQSRPGDIVNFGKTFLGRKLGWYHHATVAQNQEVREQLYAALSGDGASLQSATLDRIRLQLGINSEGKSTLVTQMTAREIKMIISDVEADNANVKARQDFCKELCKSNIDPAAKGIAGRLLKLDNSAEAIKPLSEDEKPVLKAEFKSKCIEFFKAEMTKLGISGADELERLLPGNRLLDSFRSTLSKGLVDGAGTAIDLGVLKSNFNEEFILNQDKVVKVKVRAALDKLTEEIGYDASGCTEGILEGVLEKVSSSARTAPTILKDTTHLDDLINQLIAEYVQERKTIVAGILQAEPPLDQITKNALIEIVLSETKLRDSKVALILAKHASMAGDIFEYSREENPTMAGMLDKFRHWEVTYDQAVQDITTACSSELGGDDLMKLYDWLILLGRKCYAAKYNTPLRMSEPMKSLMKSYYAEVEYLRHKPADGMDLSKPYAYSEGYAKNDGYAHFYGIIGSVYGAFGEDEPDVVNPADGLSKEVGDFMTKSGLVRKRIRDPWDKVIDTTLGSAFNDAFRKEYKSSGARGANEELGDFPTMFHPVTVDLYRAGSGLKLGGKVISIVGDDKIIGGLDAIKKFFDEDDTDGVVISRVMSDILHQGFPACVFNSIAKTGEGYGIPLIQFDSHAIDFDVTREANGYYLIKARFTAIPGMCLNDAGHPQFIDTARSRLDFECTLKVITATRMNDDKKIGEVSVEGAPKLHAELHKIPFTQKELDELVFLEDANGVGLKNTILQTPGMGSDANLKRLLAAKPRDTKAVYDYVQDKIIMPRDRDTLMALGLNANLIEQLETGLKPNVRLTKDLVKRLNSANAEERTRAFDELKAMCKVLSDEGWQYPIGEFDPDDIALVTVGGLNGSKGASKYTDLEITRAYIKASTNAEIRGIPAALASNDPPTQAAAKVRLREAMLEAKRSLGVNYLKRIPERISDDEVAMLAKSPEDYKELIQRHLENIILQNGYMEDSIRVLHTTAIALKKLANG